MKMAEPFASFDELPAEAQELFDAAGTGCFFSSMPWYRTFAKYAVDAGDRLRIYCAGAENPDGTLQAILAAMEKTGEAGRFKKRKLTSLSSYYTSLFGPIMSGADEKKAAAELARTIASERPRWDEVELRPLDVDAPSFGALVEGLQGAGFVVQTFFCFGNWYLDVRGRSFAEYTESLPSVLKNTLSRKRKKLEKSGRAKIQIVTGGSELEDAIQDYNKVYLASWKKPEPYPEFVPELIRTCAGLGALRLGLLHVDGQPAAAQFWITLNGTALIYKLAYNEQYADLSVGTILTATMMEQALNVDRVVTVDYLTGDDAYKKDWMSARRERWGILAMNPRTVRGAAAIARHVGGRAAKRFLNSLAKRTWRPQGSPQAA